MCAGGTWRNQAQPFLHARFVLGERDSDLLELIIEMSTDAVKDTAVEVSTANEHQRIEWAHEYGLIAVVPTRPTLITFSRRAFTISMAATRFT